MYPPHCSVPPNHPLQLLLLPLTPPRSLYPSVLQSLALNSSLLHVSGTLLVVLCPTHFASSKTFRSYSYCHRWQDFILLRG